MLKFLFGRKPDATAAVETQRQVFERLVADLNAIIEDLPVKPVITVDPNTGVISMDAPEQFPDEALALPAPEETEASEAPVAETEAAKAA